MHLGNGAITPGCAVVAGAGALAGLAICAGTATLARMDRRKITMAGLLGAFVFAAQTMNIPILPFASAHLIGGVLLAWVLGPALSPVLMTVVLLAQAAMLGDGAISALGANVINMGLVPALVVVLVRKWMAASDWKLQIGVASLVSTVGAAGLIVGEVAFLRPSTELESLRPFALEMISTHAMVGMAEGMATIALVWLLNGEMRMTGYTTRRMATVVIVLCVVAGLLHRYSSRLPDGYEASARHSGLLVSVSEAGH